MLVLSFGFIHLKSIENFILEFEKIIVTEFGLVIMNVTKFLPPPRVRTLFDSHTSLWISSRGSDVLVMEGNDFRVFLPWTHISHVEDASKEDLRMRFKLIIFLIELKLTCPSLPCQISQDSMFNAIGIEILLSEEFITLRRKRPSQTKPFPMKILDLEITNLLDFLTIL